jgi:hypothetical protein
LYHLRALLLYPGTLLIASFQPTYILREDTGGKPVKNWLQAGTCRGVYSLRKIQEGIITAHQPIPGYHPAFNIILLSNK